LRALIAYTPLIAMQVSQNATRVYKQRSVRVCGAKREAAGRLKPGTVGSISPFH
jgi:hypothetical protein